MLCIYSTSDYIEAHIIRGMLEQQQVDCHIGGYYLQGGVGEVPVSGNTLIWVEDCKADRAREIIRCYDPDIRE